MTAHLLYDRLRGHGARQVGWKLGATDAAGQRLLATDRPFVAPVHDLMSAPLGIPISLSRFVSPLLEVEIGVEQGSSAARLCVEIADSRFPGWVSSLPEAIADFGLQGLMLFGAPVSPAPVVRATVWHDKEVRATGSRSLAEARALARTVKSRGAADTAAFVATGTITPALPLATGRWRIEVCGLDSVEFDVVP